VTSFPIPARLAGNCAKSPAGRSWLERLPSVVDELRHRWSVSLGDPFDGREVSASWVAPATRDDGTTAVLKVGMPHLEADHEIAGLRFWAGRPTVLLLEADEPLGAMLLERCDPGTWLREVPEEEQDEVIAVLLEELWREPPDPHPFSLLSEMIRSWIEETVENEARWPDAGLVREGLATFEELIVDERERVLLATDLHAGNVLRAERSPWLVIDPKPFVGDRTYDATQHLLNCEGRMRQAPEATLERFAALLELDADRLRRWMFARTAAENRDAWEDETWLDIARHLGS
jgi:streptomycin 6-kinase